MKERLEVAIENKAVTDYTIHRLMNGHFSFHFMKICDPIQFIKDHYLTVILDAVPSGYLSSVLSELYQYFELRDYLDRLFCAHVERADDNEICEIIDVYLKYRTEKEKVSFLKNYFSMLVDSLKFSQLYQLAKYQDLDEEFRKILNDRIVENKSEYIKSFSTFLEKYNTKDHYANIVYLISNIIDEVLENEKLDWSDIKVLPRGFYSDVLEIGSKILKFGCKRERYRMPFHRRVLQPLIRINLSDFVNRDSLYKGTIEVSEKVDTVQSISEEELYSLYKEMRDDGIIFTDMKGCNVGVLLKDNVKHWSKEIGHSKRAVGYLEEDDYHSDILKAGELVVLDTDFIYYEDDPDIGWPYNTLSYCFEDRYQREKKNNARKRI